MNEDQGLAYSVDESIPEYWERFLQGQTWTNTPPTLFDAFAFGDSAELADRLAGQVIQRKKTATCEALWSYETHEERLPMVSAHNVILDGQRQPVAVIQTIEVALRTFDQIDGQFAYDEGGGDRSLAHWRFVHETYFRRTLSKIGREFTPEIPLICERFRVLWT